MSTRRRITATVDDRVVILKGWQVASLAREAGAKPIFSAAAGGWMIDRHRLGDVLAYLEQRNIAVTLIGEKSGDATVPGAGNPSRSVADGGGLW